MTSLVILFISCISHVISLDYKYSCQQILKARGLRSFIPVPSQTTIYWEYPKAIKIHHNDREKVLTLREKRKKTTLISAYLH